MVSRCVGWFFLVGKVVGEFLKGKRRVGNRVGWEKKFGFLGGIEPWKKNINFREVINRRKLGENEIVGATSWYQSCGVCQIDF